MSKKKKAAEANLWDRYMRTIETVIGPSAKSIAALRVQDMVGFWFMWHMFDGDNGLKLLGYNRTSLWRQHRLFEAVIGTPVADAWPEMREALASVVIREDGSVAVARESA